MTFALKTAIAGVLLTNTSFKEESGSMLNLNDVLWGQNVPREQRVIQTV